MRRHLAPALALCAGLALAAASRAPLEEAASAAPAIRNPAFLPSGTFLRTVSFGQRLLLSDLYWLQTVQYMGESVMHGSKRFEALAPLTDIVTDLDPRHGYAYQVVGSSLAGLAHRYDEADRILKKGMAALPDRWSLPFVYATNKFVFQQDYAEAAIYARRAAEIGQRPHLALLAANLSALADTDDEYRAAIAFLDEMEDKAGTEEMKAELAERRRKVETFMRLSRVEKALADFERAEGRKAARLDELAPRFLPEVPPDPSGAAFQYDAATGAVKSPVFGGRTTLRVTR